MMSLGSYRMRDALLQPARILLRPMFAARLQGKGILALTAPRGAERIRWLRIDHHVVTPWRVGLRSDARMRSERRRAPRFSFSTHARVASECHPPCANGPTAHIRHFEARITSSPFPFTLQPTR